MVRQQRPQPGSILQIGDELIEGEWGKSKEPASPGRVEELGLQRNSSYALAFSRSRPTLSSTPLMNWMDSGLENLRAISMASLITTARGVCG